MSDPILKRMFDLMYPIGSVYISVNNTNPQVLFGGTWVQVKDRFLLGCGDMYSNGKTGGEATHKLTINELPKNSMRIPHVAYYDDCSISGGGWKQSGRGQMEKEGAIQSVTNDGWHIMSIGNNEAHNNMPPYLAVYIWKRTA
jgi:hypothetical protein